MGAHVLLVETTDGVPVAVRFASLELARDFEERHDLSVVACVPIVTQSVALRDATR